MTFKHPANGYRENATGALSWLWCLLFGSVYFAYKGVWRHAVLSFLLVTFTLGLSWFIYPFFVYGIVNRSYLRRGWVPA
jgi:hypothetical protein